MKKIRRKAPGQLLTVWTGLQPLPVASVASEPFSFCFECALFIYIYIYILFYANL